VRYGMDAKDKRREGVERYTRIFEII